MRSIKNELIGPGSHKADCECPLCGGSSASPGCYIPIELWAKKTCPQLSENVRADLIRSAGLDAGSATLDGTWRCIMHHIRYEIEQNWFPERGL